jgi:hypothetical protein
VDPSLPSEYPKIKKAAGVVAAAFLVTCHSSLVTVYGLTVTVAVREMLPQVSLLFLTTSGLPGVLGGGMIMRKE